MKHTIAWTVAPICFGLITGCVTINQPSPTLTATEATYYSTGQNGYRWANVAMGAGGFATGIYPHPLQQDLVYLKTDNGGFYRWNPVDKSWIPLTDHFPPAQNTYYGGEALAVDPNNPNIVYIAAGKYTAWELKGTIFKSTNQGTTWTKLKIDLPMGSNQEQRWAGERLAVNPFNSNIIFFGSRQDGLWKSADAGVTWAKVSSFPQTFNPKVGILSIAFDKQKSGLVYANVYGEGIYQSTDTGTTWSKMAGSPTQAQRMAVTSNGTLYVSHESGVSKYTNGIWSDITPNGNPAFFNGLAVNPTDPNDVLAVLGQSTSTKIYRTLDGGATWTEQTASTNRTVPWRNSNHPFTVWTSSIEFDPKVPGKVWLADGFGTWQTDNINTKPALWTDYVKGIEQTVTFSAIAAPKGAALLTGVADINGFYHDKGFNTYPSKSFSSSGAADMNTLSLAYSESDPLRIVRVGGTEWNSSYKLTTSRDGGLTWKKVKEWKSEAVPLRVAISATNPNLFVVAFRKTPAFRTTDGGASWSAVSGLPNGPDRLWYWGQPLVADKVDGQRFYYYSDGKLYRSNDGGASFNIVNSSLEGEYWSDLQCKLQTLPGVRDEVWLSLGVRGLFRSTNGGQTFTKLSSVEGATLFAFGKPPAGSTTPALYLYGKIAGQGEGIFRSLDQGQTWLSIGSRQNPIGNDPIVMEASWQQFGLVFIGTNGRGFFYGIPATTEG